jgi:hypothetical protein
VKQERSTRLLALPAGSSFLSALVGDIIVHDPGGAQERVLEVTRTDDGMVTLLLERVPR